MKRSIIKYRELVRAIISIIIAFFLWAFVMSEVDPVITKTIYKVPIKFEGLETLREKEYILNDLDGASVNVVVRGNRKTINSLSPEEISASVDLSNVIPGAQSLKIEVKINQTQVSLVEADPARLAVEVDQTVTESFPLEVRYSGDLPEGYVLEEAVLNGDQVEVTGPKKLLDQIDKLVSNIKLTDRKESTLVTSPILVLDEEEKPIKDQLSLDPVNSEVQLSIAKTASVPIEIKYSADPPADFMAERVSLSPANVSIIGDSTVIKKIKNIETEAINPYRLMEGQTEQVGLVLPEGVRLVNPTDSFLIRYEQGEIIQKTLDYPIEDIKIIGGEEKSFSFGQAGHIRVQIKGEAGLLNALDSKDLSLSISLEGLGPGDHTRPIEAQGPNNIEILSLDPQEVDITIKSKER
ncbi:MAG: CdaR family protein [Tissierellia bacterium]|nr:CdaR family protein [Tissierellia bacterium]